MTVVIVDYGRIVKQFHSASNARDYFNSVTAKRLQAWLVDKNTALRLGYL